ncbi:MAG: winged helix DNA-binding protein [Acidobacteriales bacterium]|nr:winged helix DNA-binding protein [Terriglobales bacterium]
MELHTGAPSFIKEFLGSTRIFVKAVDEVLEEKLLAQVAGQQLTPSLMKVLELVAFTDVGTLSELAAFLGISTPAASKAVDKMVRRKLLSRTGGESDRRSIRVSLTEEGRRMLAAYDFARSNRLMDLFTQFPPEDLKRVATLMDQISAAVVRQTDKAEDLCLQCGIHFREKCLVRQLLHTNCSYQEQRDRRRRLQATAGEDIHERSNGMDRGSVVPKQP